MHRILKAALFDFDGTLAPSLPLWLKAYHIALARFAIQLTDDEVLARCFFRDWDVIAADFGTFTGEQLQIEIGHGLQQAFATAELFPQARALVELCREHGLKTALVTSSPRSLIASVAERLDVGHLFDFVICGDEVANYKPHPEPVLASLTALECAARNAVMIGDSHVDILAGKAAGTHTALFLPDGESFHDRDKLHATLPDFVFKAHHELPAFLGLPALTRTYLKTL